MALLYVSEFWNTGLDVGGMCRNWTQDAVGTQRRMGNRAGAVGAIAQKLNHLLARQARVDFGQAQISANAEATGVTGLYQYRYYDTVENARTRRVRVVGLAPSGGSGTASVAVASAGSSDDYHSITVAPAFPADIFYLEFDSSRGAASDALLSDAINTANGLTVLDVVVQDLELSALDDTIHSGCKVGLATTAKDILGTDGGGGLTPLRDVKDALHELRATNLGIEICWAATKTASGWADSGTLSVPGDQRGLYVTSTSYVNLLDQAVTSRSASSPGLSCAARYGGMGPVGNTLLFASVYGYSTGHAGTVKFEGPLDNVEITIPVDTAPAWCDATAALSLDSTASDSDTTSARNKVDIFGKCDTGGDDLYIYGFMAQRIYAWA